MSVTTLSRSAAMIAALLVVPSARGDAILTLGVFSSASESPGGSAPIGSTFNMAVANQPTPFTLAVVNPSPAPAPAPAPAASPAPVPTFVSVSSPTTYDASINFGGGLYLNAGSLTSGNPQAWNASSGVANLFGGQPNAQQVASFDAIVLQRVQQTFQLGGVPVSITDDPNAQAAHTLSVVSHAVNPSIPGAIGMTNVGGNGFHFIDNSAHYARSVDQLEWIVAHNVAHELMLAFGVPEIHDQTGHSIDSTIGQMSMFLNPTATFSPGAVEDLLSKNFQQPGAASLGFSPQLVGPTPAPEPTTWLAWGVGALGLALARTRARSRRLAA